MDTIKSFIYIDYKEHKRTLLLTLLCFHVLNLVALVSSVFFTKLSLYEYDTITKSYYLTGDTAALPEDCIGAGCILFLFFFTTAFSFLLPFLLTKKCYLNGSICLIDRLPKRRYHYLLSKYLPGVLVVTINYIASFCELIIYYLLYDLLLPSYSTLAASFQTFMESRIIGRCFPLYTPYRFILILLAALFIPALGLIICELPKGIGRFHYHITNAYKKGRNHR